jgi:formylglycine-generating enzyme required for sulfatase activity
MTGERHALLVGCGTFDDANIPPLPGALRDVKELKRVLEDRGRFATVTPLLDPSLAEMREAIAKLYHGRRKDDFILFYFAGHGRLDPLEDEFYYLVRNSKLLYVSATAVEREFLLKQMRRSGARRQAVILDCCHAAAALAGAREVPPERVLDEHSFAIEGYGTEFLAATDKLLLAHEEQGVGLFTDALIEGLKGAAGADDAETITLRDLDDYVRARLAERIADPTKDMRPIYGCHTETTFPLVTKQRRRLPLPPDLVEALTHDVVYARLGAVDALLDRVAKEPLHAPDAIALIERRLADDAERDFQVRAKLERARAQLAEAPAPRPLTIFRDVDAPWCPEMVAIPAGRFTMGSPPDEEGRWADEGPQHEVDVPAFAIGRYPVTFAEYDDFCEATGRDKPGDAGWGRGRRPVINVSWDDAAAYLAWLSEVTGKPYRLPSEAEWEYAGRAGTTTARYAEPLGDIAWFGENSGGRTHPVGEKAANGWGLHDTLGNVWEWCADHWHGGYESAPQDGAAWLDTNVGRGALRVRRGGSWGDVARNCRAAYRFRLHPDNRLDDLGFRPARGQG